MWHLTACKIPVSQNDQILNDIYGISKLMFATLI